METIERGPFELSLYNYIEACKAADLAEGHEISPDELLEAEALLKEARVLDQQFTERLKGKS
jgi:hypothetical protein